MSASKKPRSECAKDSASGNGVSKKASAGRRKDGKGKAGEFSVLPKSAGLKQHMVYMKKHTGAIVRSLRVDLGSSWCLGYELTRIKATLGLRGEKWDAHCIEVVGKTSRQAREYMVLAKAYSSAEEMIEKVGETVSFANAVVTARALVNPEPTPAPTPEPTPDKVGEGTQSGSKPVTIQPPHGGAGGNGSPTGDRKPPASRSDGAGMLDDIIRIAVQFADDLALLGKVHAILVKAEAKVAQDASSGKGCSKSKAKSRKPAVKKKRGKTG